MGFRDLLDRLRGPRTPSGDPGLTPQAPDRGTHEETILVAPAPPGRAEAPATQLTSAPAVASQAAASPAPPPPSPLQSPPPTPVARPNPEVETQIASPASGETEAGIGVPGAPAEDATALGQAPPAVPRPRAEASASFPRPSPAPSSIRPVPRRAVNHRLKSEEEVAGVFVGLNGPLHRLAFVIPRGRATIGSASECVVRLDDEAIAALHAELDSAGCNTTVIPIDAACRVEVNGNAIAGSCELSDGDLVRFGDPGASVLRYRSIESWNGPR